MKIQISKLHNLNDIWRQYNSVMPEFPLKIFNAALLKLDEKLHFLKNITINKPSLLAKLQERLCVELIFVDAEEIRAINKEYRSKDSVTDVLSFPNFNFCKALPQDDFDLQEIVAMVEIAVSDIYLGTVIICPDIALKQAKEYGHSLEREIVFLFVHSLLHLLGFDHELSAVDEAEHFSRQEEIMQALALPGTDNIDNFYQYYEQLENIDDLCLEILEDEIYDDGHNSKHLLHNISKCGFVAIVGRTNAGKSSLLNYIAGNNLAIVSHKAQTTRNNIRLVYNYKDTQMIFVDTPGLHYSDSKLGDFMLESAWQSLESADLVLMLIEAGRLKKRDFELNCLAKAKELNKKLIIVISKCDLVAKESLLPFIDYWSREESVETIVPISVKKSEGIDELLRCISSYLPFSPPLYSEDDYTDQTERQLAAEYLREQILKFCHEEIPHGVAVMIDNFQEIAADTQNYFQERSLVKIYASVICEKKSHKGIIIGKGGVNLKRIASACRLNLEKLLQCKVYLEIYVKVRSDWKNNPLFLSEYGYKDN